MCRRVALAIVLSSLLALSPEARATAQVPDTAPALPQGDFLPLFDGRSLSGWVVERESPGTLLASQGVLVAADDAGWVRTERTEFKTFTLRFEARTTHPRTRAVFAMFGLSPSARLPGNAWGISLFPGEVPDPATFARLRLEVLPPVDREAPSVPPTDWQPFEVVRGDSRIVVSRSGRILINQVGPRTLDGWLGFLAQGGSLEIRNLQLGPGPPPPESLIDRPGGGVSVPRLLKKQDPRYTREAMAAGIQGLVVLECVVGPDGTVREAIVVRSLDQKLGLDDEAIRAARQWRFSPGLRNGEPVSVLVTIELTFSLKN